MGVVEFRDFGRHANRRLRLSHHHGRAPRPASPACRPRSTGSIGGRRRRRSRGRLGGALLHRRRSGADVDRQRPHLDAATFNLGATSRRRRRRARPRAPSAAPASAPARCRSSSPSATPSGTTRPAPATATARTASTTTAPPDNGVPDARATAITRARPAQRARHRHRRPRRPAPPATPRRACWRRRTPPAPWSSRPTSVPSARARRPAPSRSAAPATAGAGEAPDGGGNCPLAYSFDDASGNGVGDAVTSRHRGAGQRPQVRHPRRSQRRRPDDRRQLHAQAGAEPVGRRARRRCA